MIFFNHETKHRTDLGKINKRENSAIRDHFHDVCRIGQNTKKKKNFSCGKYQTNIDHRPHHRHYNGQ